MTVSFGELGADGAATWSPTRTDWPGVSWVAQSEPVHVMVLVVLPGDAIVHDSPQLLTMDVAPGDVHEIDHCVVDLTPVTVNSDT